MMILSYQVKRTQHNEFLLRNLSKERGPIYEEKGNLIVQIIIATKTLGQRKILSSEWNPTFLLFVLLSLYFSVIVKYGITC